VFGRGAGGRADQVHRAQRPPGEDPAEDRGQGDDHGQRDQRVLQQVGQGEVTLVLRALLLKVGDALGHGVLVGVGSWLLGQALRRDASRNVAPGRRRLRLARRP
jgi:hypothetical protein